MPSDAYVSEAPKRSGPCSVRCLGAVVVIAIVAVAGIVIIQNLPDNGGNGGNGGADYDTRTIDSYSNQDVTLYPTFYPGEFDVYSSETQTSTVPDLYFDITVNTGSDSVSVSVHIAVYDTDLSTFDSLSWEDLDNYYLVGEDTYTGGADDFINLYNYAETYTWVIWFDASFKSDTWDVDITLTLRYNWNL
jgi:hypothetical protein